MFHASRVAGSSDFATFFNALAIPQDNRLRAVARFLDVSESSVKLWLSGKRNPPRSAVIALWHETHYGRAVTAAHSAYGETLARGFADAMAEQNRALKRQIDSLNRELIAAKMAATGPAQAINDPIYRTG